jgi:low affinity Fe/Cu permease
MKRKSHSARRPPARYRQEQETEVPVSGVKVDEANYPFTERFAHAMTRFAGSTAAFITALLCIVAWAVSGPLFGYGENWQLVINTGTTIITFLMVFLIQRTQNKDSLAVHLKLNELVAALEGASNRLVTAEDLSEDELEILRRNYRRLTRDAQTEQDVGRAHSIDEQGPQRSSDEPAVGGNRIA